MCRSCDDRFGPLNDDISDLFGGADERPSVPVRPLIQSAPQPIKDITNYQLDQIKQFEETCNVCKGSGQFRAWSGRIVGPCRRCKGRGKQAFATSPEQRAANKTRYAQQKVTAAQQTADDLRTWYETYAEEYQWLKSNPNFEFASSLMSYLQRNGSLTDGQLNAVRKCVARNKARDEARQADRVVVQQNAPVCTVAKIEQAFAAARANHIKRPKLRLGSFIFSMAPEHGNNAGSIYVVEASTKNYLGKVSDGQFFRVRNNCTEEQEAEVVAVASDPESAARAYGQRTGNCSACGKGLTRNESIDRMMGPICAEKYGW